MILMKLEQNSERRKHFWWVRESAPPDKDTSWWNEMWISWSTSREMLWRRTMMRRIFKIQASKNRSEKRCWWDEVEMNAKLELWREISESKVLTWVDRRRNIWIASLAVGYTEILVSFHLMDMKYTWIVISNNGIHLFTRKKNR